MPRDWAVDVRPTSTNSTPPAEKGPRVVVLRVSGAGGSNKESGERILTVTRRRSARPGRYGSEDDYLPYGCCTSLLSGSDRRNFGEYLGKLANSG